MDELEDISLESLQQICRSCLIYDYLFSIDDVHMEGISFRDVLKLCASIQLDDDPILPQNMCKACVLKFYEINRFFKVFNESQTILTKVVEKCNAAQNVLLKISNTESDFENETDQQCVSDIESVDNNEETETIIEDVKKEPPVDYLMSKIEEIKSEITNLKTVKYRKTGTHRNVRRIASLNNNTAVQKRVKIIGPPFICEVCSHSYNTYVEIRKHWQLTNHRPKNFKCTYCSHCFRSNNLLQQHIRTHTGEKPNTCHICARSFNHRSNFRRHMFTHSDAKRYKCQECDCGFNRLEFLKDHQRKYHSAEKLLCTYCGRAFTCQGSLKLHEKHHIGIKPTVNIDPNIPFQCKTCGKILASEEILNTHIKIHDKKKTIKIKKIGEEQFNNERRDFRCEHCQTNFKNSYTLHLHKLESECNQFVQQFPCTQCTKVCITYGALYAHLKIHKEEARNTIYMCEICEEQFDKERRYKDHVKRHSRERKFICSDCGQGFYIKLHLENHMRTHTGEKPYGCDVCNKAFALKVNLTVHKRIHLNIKPFKCVFCLHEFRDASSMRKHVKRYHDGIDNQDNSVPVTYTIEEL